MKDLFQGSAVGYVTCQRFRFPRGEPGRAIKALDSGAQDSGFKTNLCRLALCVSGPLTKLCAEFQRS